jgi:tellurite resistance protein TehA-like permease
MGTGITSILFFEMPYKADWLYWISVVIFCINVALFLLFTIISVVRYTLFRGIWSAMLRHPVQSLFLGSYQPRSLIQNHVLLFPVCYRQTMLTRFLGTIPMGLATIVNMIVFVCVPAWGPGAATLAWVLWWIDVVLAVGTNFYLPFIIMHKHNVRFQQNSARRYWGARS